MQNTTLTEKNKIDGLVKIAIALLETKLVSGHGMSHTANPKSKYPKPYIDVSIEDIFDMAATPPAITKDQAQWVLPSTVGGELAREHKFQAENGEFHILWADLDEVKGKTFQEIKEGVNKAVVGHAALVYTTRGAEKDDPRSRVIIPLKSPITGSEYKLASHVLNDRIAAAGLIPDRANEGTAQICGLPNRGNHYEYAVIDGPAIAPLIEYKKDMETLKANLEEERKKRQAKTASNKKKAIIRTFTGHMTLIERFLETFPLEDVLLEFGYEPIGDRWLYPDSESYKPGVFIFEDNPNKWGSFHSSMAAIGHPGEDCVCFGDAFDLFVFHEHAGDQDKAMAWAKAFFKKQDELSKEDILGYHKEQVKELNQYLAALVKGKFWIIDESVSPISGRPKFSLISAFDLRNRLKNKTLPDPVNSKNTISLSEVWLNSPHRREYDGIVFDPSEAVGNNYYNLWKGFAVKPQKGNWMLFQRHILDVIASGNMNIAKWIVAWMARIVQDPGGERPGTAIVLRGRQGTGKGVFVKFFGRFLGDHYKQVAQAGQVTGRFNHHLKNALLVFVDEGFWAGDKQAEGVIKNMITEPNIAIEQKGKDVIQVRNHINLIMASNNSWVVPAGLEERRFLVLDVSDSHQQDHDYFNAITDQMENGGIEAMLHDLLNFDITGINLREVPQTQALWEQKQASMTPVQKYWYDRLQEGTVLQASTITATQYGDTAKLGWDIVPQDDLYQDFLNFAKNINARPIEKAQLTTELNKLCSGIGETKKGPRGPGRVRCRTFPALDVCRKQFEARVKMTFDWD